MVGVLRAGDRGSARRSTTHALRRRGAHFHLLRGIGEPTPLWRLRAHQPSRHHLRRPRRRDARGVAHHGLRQRRGGAQHRLRRPRRRPRRPAGLSRPQLGQSQHLGGRSRLRRRHPCHFPIRHLHRVRIRGVLPRPVPVGELLARRTPAPPPSSPSFHRRRVVASGTQHTAHQQPPRTRSGTARQPSPAPSRPTTCPGTSAIRSTARQPSPPTSTAPPIRCGDGRAAAVNTQTSCSSKAPNSLRRLLRRRRAGPGCTDRAEDRGSAPPDRHRRRRCRDGPRCCGPLEEIEIPLPGRSARSDRRSGLALSGKDRWIRLQIPVVVHDGHLRIPT